MVCVDLFGRCWLVFLVLVCLVGVGLFGRCWFVWSVLVCLVQCLFVWSVLVCLVRCWFVWSVHAPYVSADEAHTPTVWCAFSDVFPYEASPMTIHAGMFLPALQSQCSEQQKDLWLSRAQRFEIIGTYAQSELGHGTCQFVSSPKLVLLRQVCCQCSSVGFSVKCSASAPQSNVLPVLPSQSA